MKESSEEARTGRGHDIQKNFWSGQLGLTLVTVSLVVFIFVIVPMHRAGLPARLVFDMVIVTLMIWGVLDVGEGKVTKGIAVGVVLATVVVLWASIEFPSARLEELACVMLVAVTMIYVWVVLGVVFRRGTVTWGRVQGGVAAYLLMGMAWAPAYELVELWRPGSFHFTSAPADIYELFGKLLYFSFTTLTTVGFGDVTPIDPFARSLAIGEAVVGQLFPAILIGTLVGMALQRERG